ncbi:transposase [Sutterella wadsworthensis]|uniref:transposase n=1 Tax=Sutterella wadsworthensis TaxID=40545 RepID=UPI001F0EED82|nr:transposase [Sutterella wadsworthensis]
MDENRGAPVYYKQFIGSTPDVSAFADVLTESTLRHSDCTIIADKGFASESDFGLLDSKNLKYVIPLCRGNRFVKNNLPLTPMSYENMFPFNSRRIQALKIAEAGFNVFVFFDAQLYTKSGRCRRTLQKNK